MLSNQLSCLTTLSEEGKRQISFNPANSRTALHQRRSLLSSVDGQVNVVGMSSAGVNGPRLTGMYKLKPFFDSTSSVELPTCMYSIKSFHGSMMV